jgi:hypothetical protein
MSLSLETREWLRSVGITDAIIDFARIEEEGEYITYPLEYPPRLINDETIIYTVNRGRIIDKYRGEGKQRFFNPVKDDCPDGEMPPFYTANYKYLMNRIASSNSVVNIFEGDKNYLIAMSVGMTNSIALFGTGTPIDTPFIKALNDLGVKQIRYYPDNDNPGIIFATKFYQILSKYFDVKVISLPIQHNNNDINDFADFYAACNYEYDLFLEKLSLLPLWKIPNKEAQENAHTSDYFTKALYAEIQKTLELTDDDFKLNGFSKNIACPIVHHSEDHTNPAFCWNRESKIGYCFKCASYFLAKDVATALHIDWREYINSPESALPSNKTSVDQIRNTNHKQTLDNIVDPFERDIAQKMLSLADQDVVVSFTEGLERYNERFHGTVLPKFAPVPNPLTFLHHLGGNCRVLERPTMSLISGVSGGYKSSILNVLIRKFSRLGKNGIVFSPEWIPDRNVERTVQQEGGLTMVDMTLFQRWHYEQYLTEVGMLDEEFVFGVKPDDAKLAKTLQVIDRLKEELRGEIYYTKDFSPNVASLIAQLRIAQMQASNAGKEISYVIIDYAQMLDDESKTSLNAIVRRLKKEANDNGWLLFIASQSRKSDTENVYSGNGQILTSTSSMNLRDDEFNFSLSANPMPHIITQQHKTKSGLTIAKYYREVKIGVLKNSLGMTANTQETAISVYIDLETLDVLEEIG